MYFNLCLFNTLGIFCVNNILWLKLIYLRNLLNFLFYINHLILFQIILEFNYLLNMSDKTISNDKMHGKTSPDTDRSSIYNLI